MAILPNDLQPCSIVSSNLYFVVIKTINLFKSLALIFSFHSNVIKNKLFVSLIIPLMPTTLLTIFSMSLFPCRFLLLCKWEQRQNHKRTTGFFWKAQAKPWQTSSGRSMPLDWSECMTRSPSDDHTRKKSYFFVLHRLSYTANSILTLIRFSRSFFLKKLPYYYKTNYQLPNNYISIL